MNNNNKKIILFILAFFIIIFLINKVTTTIIPRQTTPKPQGLNASFGKSNNLGIPVASYPCITFSFTSPSSFGPSGKSFTQVVLYLSVGSSDPNTANPYANNPNIPVTDILDATKNFINPTYNSYDGFNWCSQQINPNEKVGVNAGVINTNDQGWMTQTGGSMSCKVFQIDMNSKGNKILPTPLTDKNWYWFGVAIANDVPNISNSNPPENTQLPYLISNFSFVQIQYSIVPPGAVTSLVGSFGNT